MKRLRVLRNSFLALAIFAVSVSILAGQNIAQESRDAQSYFNKGVAHQQAGRHQEAIEAYKQAIKIQPDALSAYLNLGLVYGALGRYEEAIEATKTVIQLKPDIADAHFQLGNIDICRAPA